MSRLARALAIRSGEGRLVALTAGAFAVVEAGRGLGEVGVDTLVLSRFGVGAFPYLFIGLGLVGLVVSLSYGGALGRSASERFFPGVLLVLAGVLSLEWLIALAGVEQILPLVWISVYAAGLLLLTAMWTVGGFTFDARQAKRLFPLLTSAAIVGSLAGFLSAIAVQRIVGAEALILAEALLFAVSAGLLTRLGSRIRPRRTAGEAVPSVRGALTAGASSVASSPLMRLAAIAYVLLAVLMFSLTYPFMDAMDKAFPQESALLTALALFSAAVTVASFVTGAFLANRLYSRLGVATVALALPIIYLLGFGLWIVRFTLTTAIVARFAQQVTQRGLSNAAFSAFYSVVPSRRRGQVLAFMDGVPGQVGTMLSGVLLIVATGLAIEQVFLIGLVAGAVCLLVLARARRAYASSLVATLREGRAEQVLEGGPGLQALARDSRIEAELRAATSADRADERLLAADLLGRIGDSSALVDLRRLAGDEVPGVRRAALVAIERIEGTAADDLLAAAMDDEDAGVRASAVSLLRRQGSAERVRSAVAGGLARDESAVVRGEVAVALSEGGDPDGARAIVAALLASADAAARRAGLEALADIPGGVEATEVLDLLQDPAGDVRAAAVRAAAAHDVGELATFTDALADRAAAVRAAAVAVLRVRAGAARPLLEVLASGSGSAQAAALEALAGHVDEAREGLLAWADGQVARATRLRRWGQALAGSDPDSAAGYLGAVTTRREAAIESRLLAALAVLGAPEASGLIRRCLRAPDAEVRAQAIEALDTLGDARLARGVVRLLEGDAGRAPASAVDVLAAATDLAEDEDPWVRALAFRTLSERLRAGRRALAARVRDDPEPLVREAVAIEEGDEVMPDPLQLVNDLDRMIVLRRVPLFAALDPEDLQRVAATAAERSWAEGDHLMVEGEPGDELVVIVEGSVRVVHRESGQEREVRTYGAGDHIGELAVLREAPRAATVVASAGGVRGLVISGEAIGALLRERPEAATAMLATLAERLSQQH